MSGSGRFCPRCGESIPSGAGYTPPDRKGDASAEICQSCYLEAVELVDVPDRVTVHLCASCGAVRYGNEWEDVEADDYTNIVIAAVADRLQVHRHAEDVSWTVEPQHRGPNEIDLAISVSAFVEGTPIEADRIVSVRIARETCPPCGRQSGDYYAGTVQVRAHERMPTSDETDRAVELAHEITQAVDDRDAFISEVIERPEGVDVRVSTNSLAAQIGNRVTAELGGSVDSSETLVTEDEEGEGVYRVAFAVRLPRFKPGDIIRSDDEPILILGDVRGRRLSDGEAVTIDPERDAERIGTISDVSETTLVSVEDENAIQVLDPETAAAVIIPRPADLSVDTNALHVFKREGGLHAIPASVVEKLRHE